MDALAEHPSGMLWALTFKDGRGRPAAEPALSAGPGEADWTWTHFRLSDVRARSFLARAADLPADALELIESRETRIQLHHEGGWAFGVLPDLERNLDGQATEAGRLRFALDERRLITTRSRPLFVLDDLRRRVNQGLEVEDPIAAIELFIERYLEVMEARAEELAQTLDSIEDRVLAGEGPFDTNELGPIRRELSGQKRELVSLRGAAVRATSARNGRRVALLVKPCSELVPWIEDLDREMAGLQERARLLHEEIDTRLTSATNRNMRALTVMSTLLIPPTLVAGAFGMNVRGIPFGESRAGFAIAAAVCMATVVGAWVFLRRLKVID